MNIFARIARRGESRAALTVSWHLFKAALKGRCRDMKRKSVQRQTVDKIEKAMRTWIKAHLKAYGEMAESQILTTSQGESAIKANPAVAEIRATFKDYCYIVKVQNELSDADEPGEQTSIDDLRKRFKIAK